MVVGIVGVPPWDVMAEYIESGAEIVDLDEPVEGLPVSDEYLPSSYCSILKRVVSNIFTMRKSGRLDLVLATTGECKCDGMRNIARWLAVATDIPVRSVRNDNMEPAGNPVCVSALPLKDKVEIIVNSVFRERPTGLDISSCEPVCGFWGVPPYDFSILSLFPDETHVYGWTRCMENRTPADLELECYMDPGVPTVFFCQSFCQKSALAYNLAKTHGGLFVEVDKKLSRSTKAKIEAFLQFNVYGGK